MIEVYKNFILMLGLTVILICVLFRETQTYNHYTGGEPLPAWVPSDEKR